jgi:hypothetical protein
MGNAWGRAEAKKNPTEGFPRAGLLKQRRTWLAPDRLVVPVMLVVLMFVMFVLVMMAMVVMLMMAMLMVMRETFATNLHSFFVRNLD